MGLDNVSPGHLVGDSPPASGGAISTGTAAGSPVDGPYITYATNGTLTAERILTAGTNVTITTDSTSIFISADTGASTGDITAVGDVPSGAAFNGTTGTTLTFFNLANSNATLIYQGTGFIFSKQVGVPSVATPNTAGGTLDQGGRFYLSHHQNAWLDIQASQGYDADLFLSSANGTLVSPTSSLNNDIIGLIQFSGHDGANFQAIAGIEADIDGPVTVNNVPGKLSFWTALGSGNEIDVKQMEIRSDGSIDYNNGTGILQNQRWLFVAGTPQVVVTNTAFNFNRLVILGSQATATGHAVRADRALSAGTGLSGGGDLTADRTLSINTNVRDKIVTFFFSGNLSTDHRAERVRVYIANNMEVLDVRLASVTPPTGATLLIQARQFNATLAASNTMYAAGARPVIADGVSIGSQAAAPGITSLHAGSWLGLDIDQVGSTNAGSDMTVTFILRTS